MAANSSKRTPEMSQSRQSHTILSPNTPTFPISAYLPEKRSSSHNSRRHSDRRGTPAHPGSQSSDWSKGSEKGQDSVDLGRPMSEETAVSFPQRAAMSPVQPESLAINPFSNSTPASPRSGHGRHTHGASRTTYESEKLASPLSPTSRRSRLDSVTSILDDNHCRCRRSESEDMILEEKALNVLMYLSFPNILVSFLLLVWTLIALLTALILSPFRICSKSQTISQSLTSFLVPPLRLQHALIYSARLSHSSNCRHASSRGSSANSSPSPSGGSPNGSRGLPNGSSSTMEYSLGMLVIVHLLSPLIAVGVAFAAWTAAVFWFYAAIIGDPSGSDKPMGYNDGKSSVLGVRAWWAHWLARPVKGK